MPIAHIHVRQGRSPAEKKQILDAVHAALVEAFGIPDRDRHQILHEHAPEHLDSTKGPDFTLVELSVFPGRSLEAKRRLYALLVANLQRAAQIDPGAVMIVLHEPAMESWGIRGGKAGCDVAIGFKIDV